MGEDKPKDKDHGKDHASKDGQEKKKDKKKKEKYFQVDKFEKGTMDAAICGIVRLQWAGGMSFHDVIGFALAIFMHLLCQCFTMGVILLFRLTIVNNSMTQLENNRLPLLDFKAGYLNGTFTTANATEDLVEFCKEGSSMAGYHPDIHIMMLFLWLSISTPPIWTNVWRMYIVANMPLEYEEDPDYKPEDHGGEEDDLGEPREQEMELKKGKKSKKDKKLTLDDLGGREEKDTDAEDKHKKEGRPLTDMTTCHKIIAIVFLLIPHFLTNLYLVHIGARHIVYTGSVDMLIIKALALKAIAKIDQTIFKSFAGSNLQDYMKNGGYRIRNHEANAFNKAWDRWLAPVVKVILCLIVAIAQYYSHPNVREFRQICGWYLEAENVKWSCPGYQIPDNTCGLHSPMGILFR